MNRVSRRKKPKLEEIPEGILSKIFLYACTDGGKTGCALSLVSRRIHDISRAARFNTVSLLSGSPSKTRRLLESYERACIEAILRGTATPTIAHLALALSPTLTETLPGIPPTPSERARKEHLKLIRAECGADSPQWRAHVSAVAGEHFAAVQALLDAAAPHVQTLCLYRHGAKARALDRVESPRIRCARPFAALRELSFVGDEPQFVCAPPPPPPPVADVGCSSPRAADACEYEYVPCFPVLERLHVVRGEASVLSPLQWVRDAPNLRDLRVTWLRGVPDRAFMDALREVVGEFDYLNNEVDCEDCPPSRTVVLTARPPPAKASRNKRARYYNLMCNFRADVWSVRSPVVFVPYYWDQDVSEKVWTSALINEGALWKDWLARCSGRKGVFIKGFWLDFLSDDWKDRAEIALHMGGDQYLSPLITARDHGK